MIRFLIIFVLYIFDNILFFASIRILDCQRQNDVNSFSSYEFEMYCKIKFRNQPPKDDQVFRKSSQEMIRFLKGSREFEQLFLIRICY